jgi:hypothetical protein
MSDRYDDFGSVVAGLNLCSKGIFSRAGLRVQYTSVSSSSSTPRQSSVTTSANRVSTQSDQTQAGTQLAKREVDELGHACARQVKALDSRFMCNSDSRLLDWQLAACPTEA